MTNPVAIAVLVTVIITTIFVSFLWRTTLKKRLREALAGKLVVYYDKGSQEAETVIEFDRDVFSHIKDGDTIFFVYEAREVNSLSNDK